MLLLLFLISVAALSAQTTFYGPNVAAEALGNHQIKNVDVDTSFIAEQTGTIDSIMWYNINVKQSPCTSGYYACGTGGTINISIRTDDGTGKASGTVLGTPVIHDGPANAGQSIFPVEVFGTKPSVTSGTRYHIYFTNTHADRLNNWTSYDGVFNRNPTSPKHPQIPNDGYDLYRGTTLYEPPNFVAASTPIVQINYTNGAKQGIGYTEFWYACTNEATACGSYKVSGANRVRERFTVTGGNRLVSHISVHMKRDSTNTGSSPLSLRLESCTLPCNGAGTLIETVTIPASTFPVGTLTDTSTNLQGWGTAAFAVNRTLTNGSTYAIELSAPADTIFRMQAMKQQSQFHSSLLFTDGLYQKSSDSGATWAGPNVSGTNRTDSDMQFYFTVVPPPQCSITSTAPLAPGVVGTPYSVTLTTDSCTAPLDFTTISGALPTGLSIAPSTGVISGTPTTSGLFSFTSKVIATGGSEGTVPLTILITGGSSTGNNVNNATAGGGVRVN